MNVLNKIRYIVFESLNFGENIVFVIVFIIYNFFIDKYVGKFFLDMVIVGNILYIKLERLMVILNFFIKFI